MISTMATTGVPALSSGHPKLQFDDMLEELHVQLGAFAAASAFAFSYSGLPGSPGAGGSGTIVQHGAGFTGSGAVGMSAEETCGVENVDRLIVCPGTHRAAGDGL